MLPSTMASNAIHVQMPPIQESDHDMKQANNNLANSNRARAVEQPPQSTPVIDKTMSGATNLVRLLPTGTVLAFQALSPSFTNHGTCHMANRYLTAVLIYACATSCVLLSFTDSLIGSDGKLYYGIATFRGLYVFNFSGTDGEKDAVFRDLRRFRVTALDYVHAFFSVAVFFTIAFSDAGVQSCLFPQVGPDATSLLVNLPLGAGFLSSMVFLMFPTARKGIGYTDMMPLSQ